MMRHIIPFLIFTSSVLATIIETFSDHNCQDSILSLTTHNGYISNGYPNGTCTRFDEAGKISSFQLIEADPGCTGEIYLPTHDTLTADLSVTIYANDTTPDDTCSATVIELAQPPPACYNASWVYFSIDECAPPKPISTSSLSSAATPSPSSAATPSSSLAAVLFSSAAAPSSSPTAVSSISSTPQVGLDHTTKTILGGVFGGVAGILLFVVLFSLGYYIGRHRKRHNLTSEEHTKATETPSTLAEATTPSIGTQGAEVELEGHQRRVEVEAASNPIFELVSA